MAKTVYLKGNYGYNQYKASAKDIDIIDASAASWIQANEGNSQNEYPFYITSGKSGLQVIGGSINGKISLTKNWGSVYAEGNTAGVFIKDTANVVIRDWEIDRAFDGIRLRGSQNFLIENVRFSNIRDDAIENDDGLSGTIRNSMFDGVFVGLSLGDANTGAQAQKQVVTLDHVYIRMQNFNYTPKGSGGQETMTHQSPFKMSENSSQLKIYNSVIAIENVNHSGQARLEKAWENMIDGRNNYFLNLSNTPLPKDYPTPPSGWTILQGQEAREYWEHTEANWEAGNIDDPSIPDPKPDPEDKPATKIDIEGNGEANTLIGTSKNDVIFGHGNADRLNGKEGNDTLDGGGGADIFEFDTALNQTGIDTILDFKAGVDKIHLDVNVYTALGSIAPNKTATLAQKFYKTAARAEDGNDKIIYKWNTGELFYDADSKGSGAAVKIAQLEAKLDISHNDFVLFNSNPVKPAVTIMEFGSVKTNHDAITVKLDYSFTNPIVLITMTSHNGTQVAVPRITEIDNNSFTFYTQEPSYLDARHDTETFSYVVVEKGSWILSDGTKIEAGILNTNQLSKNGFEDVSFNTDFAYKPAVLSQVQTHNGSDLVDTRQTGAGQDGFKLAMQEDEAGNTGSHKYEDLGWLAIERGSGKSNGHDFSAGSTSDSYDHNWKDIVFQDEFDELPQLIANISSHDGSDSSFVRVKNLDKKGAEIAIQEDQSKDSEVGHTTETFDFFSIEGSGHLTGRIDTDII